MAMDAPATIKDIQKLTGRMTALNRFLSRLGEWGLPIFKLLKQQDKFEWTTKAAEALENLKHHLSHRQFLQFHYQTRNYSSTLLRLLM